MSPFYHIAILSLLLVGCASSPSSFSSNAPNFDWPVRGGRFTQGFKHSSRKHDGIDIAAPKNTPIYAAAAGKVIYTGRDFSGYGKLLIIEHQGEKWASFYAHLNGFKVREGQWVQKGQKVGLMGRTGRATGVHLHFEIRHNRHPIDPLSFLNTNYLSKN